MSLMAMDMALGRGIETPEPYLEGTPGLRYAWASGEIEGAKLAYTRGEVGLPGALGWCVEALADSMAADVHLVWAWDDPRPGVRAAAGLIPRFGRARAALLRLRVFGAFGSAPPEAK